MNDTHTQWVNQTIQYVKETLYHAEGGHDWWHVYRVWQLAKTIAKSENVKGIIVELGALLHDIADAKFNDGNETIGPAKAHAFLSKIGVDTTTINAVVYIIQNISFKGGFESDQPKPIELQVVQDADRLDAIGAIGVARAFNYGGFKNRKLYNPNIPPAQYTNKEAYKNNTAPTINHFYEKLLLLKDKMNTDTGKKIALHRHQYMLHFLEQFFNEWEGKA